jgi:hypothetical protein
LLTIKSLLLAEIHFIWHDFPPITTLMGLRN